MLFCFNSRSVEIFAVAKIPPLSFDERAPHGFARNANSRPPVPEAIGSSLLTTFVDFLVLFSPKTMLMRALVRTVST